MSDKGHWQHIYSKKAPEKLTWHQHRPEISLGLIHEYLPDVKGSIIDVGAGSSTLCDYLIESGYTDISLLDLAENALKITAERLGDNSRYVSFYAENLLKFHSPYKFNLWHDRAVFHFLTASTDRELYKSVLKEATQPGSTVIISTFYTGGPQRCSGLDIIQYNARKIQTELGSEFRFIEEIRENHKTPSGKEQLFGYFVFKRE